MYYRRLNLVKIWRMKILRRRFKMPQAQRTQFLFLRWEKLDMTSPVLCYVKVLGLWISQVMLMCFDLWNFSSHVKVLGFSICFPLTIVAIHMLMIKCLYAVSNHILLWCNWNVHSLICFIWPISTHQKQSTE